jgi:hypothetical protein
MPQPPQCSSLLRVSTHSPSHSVPVLHTQLLFLQVLSLPHEVVQSPQWSSLLLVSMHSEPHIVP